MLKIILATLLISSSVIAAEHDHGKDHKHDHKKEEAKLAPSPAPLPPLAPGGYTATVNVNGMVCSFCAQGIEKKFKARKEVDAVKVDLDKKQVLINFKPSQAMSDADITSIITDAGFAVTKIEVNALGSKK